MRDAARETWRAHDPSGLDVAAIEHMDGAACRMLREDGADRANGVAIPGDSVMALLVTLRVAGGHDHRGRRSTGDRSAPGSRSAGYCRSSRTAAPWTQPVATIG
jgi:hypothetical protein